jgi:hypothetical protein
MLSLLGLFTQFAFLYACSLGRLAEDSMGSIRGFFEIIHAISFSSLHFSTFLIEKNTVSSLHTSAHPHTLFSSCDPQTLATGLIPSCLFLYCGTARSSPCALYIIRNLLSVLYCLGQSFMSWEIRILSLHTMSIFVDSMRLSIHNNSQGEGVSGI